MAKAKNTLAVWVVERPLKDGGVYIDTAYVMKRFAEAHIKADVSPRYRRYYRVRRYVPAALRSLRAGKGKSR